MTGYFEPRNTSRDLIDGVATTLRRLEREAAGLALTEIDAVAAARRLSTFQRTVARALQQAHLECVQEMAVA